MEQYPIAMDMESEYSVGKSENQPNNIYMFLQEHLNDPAAFVCGFQRNLCAHRFTNVLIGLS
jgi:hypothetical protein